jgi:hypothetical protein
MMKKNDRSACLSTKDILEAFHEHCTKNIDKMPVDSKNIRYPMQHISTRFPAIANESFETPITQGEIHMAITQGNK